MNTLCAKKLCTFAILLCAYLIYSDGYCQTGIVTTTSPATTKVSGKRPHVSRQHAFFGVHLDLHASASDTILGRDASANNIGQFLDAVKPDFVQYDCKGHAGYTGYPTEVGYSSPGIVKDALRLWREETRKRGVGLYIHYSGVLDSAAVQHHPEWARIDENGKPDPDVTSRFGNYASELMIPQLKEVTGKYDLDGVWVDGDCWGAKLDYATTAVAAWKAKTGYTEVPKSSGDPHWQEWKTFHRDAFEAYLANWVDELHRFNPDLELCSNWAYTPHMPVPVKADVDFLSGDFSAKESVDRARFEARYLDATGMPWDLMAWGFNSYTTGAPHQMKDPEQLKQEAAVVLALGGGMQVYYQPTRGGLLSDGVINTAREVGEFCRDRQTISHKTSSVPQVALLLSSTSYLQRNDQVYSPHGHYTALEGALHLLLENGYSVDLMSEHQLESKLADYPVVAIAQAAHIDSAFQAKLVQYVKNGGRLVLLDRESLNSFRDVLGVKLSDVSNEASTFVAYDDLYTPVPGEWQKFSAQNAEVLAWRTGAGDKGLTSSSLTEAAATSTTLGNGVVVAVYGPVARAYFDTHNPALRKWAGEVMARAFPSPKARLLENPNVDMSLRKTADGQEVIHLVNLSGAQRADRFAATDKIPPSGQIQISWTLRQSPKTLRLLPDNRTIPFTVTKAGESESFITDFTVDTIPIHAVVVAEY